MPDIPVSADDEASNVGIALDLGRSSYTGKHRHVHCRYEPARDDNESMQLTWLPDEKHADIGLALYRV